MTPNQDIKNQYNFVHYILLSTCSIRHVCQIPSKSRTCVDKRLILVFWNKFLFWFCLNDKCTVTYVCMLGSESND